LGSFKSSNNTFKYPTVFLIILAHHYSFCVVVCFWIWGERETSQQQLTPAPSYATTDFFCYADIILLLLFVAQTLKPSASASSSSSTSPMLPLSKIIQLYRSSSKKLVLIVIFFIGQALVLLYFHVLLVHEPSTDAVGSLLDDFKMLQKTRNETGGTTPVATTNSLWSSSQQQQRHATTSALHQIDPIEEQEAMAYIRSFKGGDKTFTRPLNFFHIPKTAGTAVEQAGAEHENKYSWGSCAFYHKPKRDICNYPKNSQEWPRNVGWWHVPRQFFPLANSNPYQNSELFAVIRDPLERMVSEFYYICTLKVKDWRPNQCDRDRLFDEAYMNEWLQNKLLLPNNSDANNATSEAMAYLIDNGHFTPQYDFLVGPHEVRMIDHVLRLEGSSHVSSNGMPSTTTTTTSLAQDFQRLVRAYGMPFRPRHAIRRPIYRFNI
jgi:Sulfotransferase family